MLNIVVQGRVWLIHAGQMNGNAKGRNDDTGQTVRVASRTRVVLVSN